MRGQQCAARGAASYMPAPPLQSAPVAGHRAMDDEEGAAEVAATITDLEREIIRLINSEALVELDPAGGVTERTAAVVQKMYFVLGVT